jgi:hypothetical protein
MMIQNLILLYFHQIIEWKHKGVLWFHKVIK